MRNKKSGTSRRMSLVTRIRFSYIIPFVPFVLLLLFIFYNLWLNNHSYADMIDSVVKASAFNMDFKHDFDNETYLLVVGQKEVADSPIDAMISEARIVVDELNTLSNSVENRERIASISKYLDNLEYYYNNICNNLQSEGTYDTNMQIWENDVQVGTTLLQETVYQYIFSESKDLDRERENQQKSFGRVITISAVAFVIVVILILVISYYFNKLLRQVQQEQVQLRKAEFLVLQSQINPHFLYNTLDAITWLAESGEHDTVVHMVDSLSGFFRASLNQGKDIVSVSEEVRHIRSYLEIQKIRYQDILEYSIDIPDEFADVKIPKITIQPLVENALYHGIKNKRGGGTIAITAETDGEDILIRVTDDGVGMNAERLKQVRAAINEQATEETGVYGLYNVNERIRLHFGDSYGIMIESEEGVGTRSVIRLPRLS
ncbi:MAG: sensor histidine kinase [Eubacterium sp.]|nr:sensor histidine kinase [Eubacterium sp.]